MRSRRTYAIAESIAAALDDLPLLNAYAFLVGTRWFVRITPRGRVQTAWALAGATLMQKHDAVTYAPALLDALRGKRRGKVSLVRVTLAGSVVDDVARVCHAA